MSQRDVKFRCWNIPLQKMHYFGLYNVYGDETMPVMQYTGLKDKNGKEIYEGDILEYKFDFKTNIYTGEKRKDGGYEHILIGFSNGSFDFQTISHQNSYFGVLPSDRKSVAQRHMDEFWEVVGNIYENPELLKGGK